MASIDSHPHIAPPRPDTRHEPTPKSIYQVGSPKDSLPTSNTCTCAYIYIYVYTYVVIVVVAVVAVAAAASVGGCGVGGGCGCGVVLCMITSISATIIISVIVITSTSAFLNHLQLRGAGYSNWPKCLHLAMLASTSEGPDLRRSKEAVLNSLAAKRDLRKSKEPVLNSLAAKIAGLNSLCWMDRRKAPTAFIMHQH